jgi:uncharacterized protein (TIRG00374 family)
LSFRRWLITALSFAAAIGVSIYIIHSSMRAEGARVSLPFTAHVLALAAAALEVVARAMKISFSAAAMRIPLRFSTSLRVCLGGDFGAAISPARSGAEPARFLILNEAGVPTASSLLILYTEIFLELLSLAIVALVLGLVLEKSTAMTSGLLGMVGGYATFVLGAGAIGILLSRRNANGPPPRWARRLGLHAGRWRAVQRSLRQLRGSVSAVRQARVWPMAASLLLSVVHVLVRLTILPIIVYSLGAQTPIAGLVLWPLAILYGGAVAPAPGGGGLIEVAFKAALGGSIPVAIFGAALLWWRVYTFYVNLAAGALVAGNAVMRALRREREAEVRHASHRHHTRDGVALEMDRS